MTMPIEREMPAFRGLSHECTDPNCHVGDFIRSVEDIDPVSIIQRDVQELKDTVRNLIELIEPIKEEVSPLMDKLAASPMFKMITGG